LGKIGSNERAHQPGSTPTPTSILYNKKLVGAKVDPEVHPPDQIPMENSLGKVNGINTPGSKPKS